MAATTERDSGVTIHEVSPRERWEIFDRAAQHYLQMTGAQFIQEWDVGKFDTNPDEPRVTRVALLRPSGP